MYMYVRVYGGGGGGGGGVHKSDCVCKSECAHVRVCARTRVVVCKSEFTCVDLQSMCACACTQDGCVQE